MKKFILMAVVFASTQSFAAITTKTLNCGAAKDGVQTLVGMDYKVQITYGFDTHVKNPDGSIGAAFGPEFVLLSQIVSPTTPVKREELTLVSKDSKGNYNLKGESVTVTVAKKLNKAVILIGNRATATCK